MVPKRLKLQPEPVEEEDDPRVSDFVGLSDGQRRREGFFVAEGALVIRQLLGSRYPLRAVLATAQGLAALEDDLAPVDAPVYVVPQRLMTAITGFHFHRGALASAERRPQPDLATVAAGARLLVVAEGVNDNENLGALFRNAAAFGVEGVVIDSSCADPLYRRTVRVSMGQVLRLPWARVPDAAGAARALRAGGFEVLALAPAGSDDVRTVRARPPQALLVGAEGPGLSGDALAAADRTVRVTMASGVDSLNVATAAAVVLHQLSPGTPPAP